ncbi:MAG TPA: nucleotidyltransferase domain-containing protein [Phycisphaerae bacterium]|nr:nucleotidyltransferase domain-containing protein [Phycisphaerae bacterium]
MRDSTSPLPEASAEVVSCLAESNEVKGILCFGSFATATADEHSDIDLFVVCDPQVISPADRRRILQGLPAVSDLRLDHVSPGFDNQWNPHSARFHLGRDLFEVVYNTADWLRAVVKAVAKEGKASVPELPFRPYTMLGMLDNSIILHDPESFLGELIEGLYPYPKKLKAGLIRDSLAVLDEALADLADYHRRRIGNSAFLFHLNRMNDALTTLLFAINEKYDPANKRVEHDLGQLRLLPANFLPRYSKILAGPFDEKGRSKVVEEYTRLLAEAKRLANDVPRSRTGPVRL